MTASVMPAAPSVALCVLPTNSFNQRVSSFCVVSWAAGGRDTVAEGVVTTESAKALAEREGVDMPIVAAVHRILFERQPARWALVELMTRGLRGEED